jgi:DNA-binding response OmpR family regulator
MARILIIEDESALRSLMKDALENADHEVMEASDGNMGVKMFNENKFDVVITDILMPKKEGLEVILEMTDLSPDVKIIAISGGGIGLGDDLLDIYMEFGAKKALRKPVRMEHLLDVVKDVMKP